MEMAVHVINLRHATTKKLMGKSGLALCSRLKGLCGQILACAGKFVLL